MEPGVKNHSLLKISASSAITALSPYIFGMSLTCLSLFNDEISSLPTKEAIGSNILKYMQIAVFSGGFISNIAVYPLSIPNLYMSMLANLLYAAGFGLSLTLNKFSLLSGYFSIGLGCGIMANAVPCYLNEIAPAEYRGIFTSLYTIGLISGLASGNLLSMCKGYFTFIVIGLAVFSLLNILLHIFRLELPASTVAESYPRLSFIDFIATRFARKSILIITVLHIATNLCGINHIVLCINSILGENNANFNGFLTNSWALIVSCFATSLVNRLGRKFLIIISIITVMASNFAFYQEWNLRIFLFIFILGYNFGLSAIPFILIGEIFPGDYIGQGAMYATSCNWLSAILSVIAIVPNVTKHNPSWLVYNATLLVTLVALLVCFKETKNKKPAFQ
ncbi:hypothetical protein ENBRE01_1546 [Enteropsectra breve]|nr:hypothetical protein ENBRE01_1546 [Enteropsectra breve]